MMTYNNHQDYVHQEYDGAVFKTWSCSISSQSATIHKHFPKYNTLQLIYKSEEKRYDGLWVPSQARTDVSTWRLKVGKPHRLRRLRVMMNWKDCWTRCIEQVNEERLGLVDGQWGART